MKYSIDLTPEEVRENRNKHLTRVRKTRLHEFEKRKRKGGNIK